MKERFSAILKSAKALLNRVLAWFKEAPFRRALGMAVVAWAAYKALQVVPAGLMAVEEATVILAIGLAEIARLLAPLAAPFLAMVFLTIVAYFGVVIAE